MNTALTDALLASGSRVATSEYRGAATPVRFSDAKAEWQGLQSGCGVYDLGYRAKIVLAGKDRTRWLNGMISNNVRDLAACHGTYAFLLNAQGHILGDLYAYNRGETLVLDTDAAQVEKIVTTFKRYIIMDKVELTVASDLTAIGVAGPKAREVFRAAKIEIPELEPLQFATPKCDCDCGCLECTVVRGDTPYESYELWIAPQQVKALWESLIRAGAAPVGAEVIDMTRIVNGIPQYGVDIRERELPQETEQARALSFTKGCYIGQEIVERIRARGAVHRKLSGFLSQTAIPPGAKISAAGKEVGEITSATSLLAAGSDLTLALGYTRREAASVGAEVSVDNARAAVVALPLDIENSRFLDFVTASAARK